jgi:hypothetical protein
MSNERLIPLFVPSLAALLANREQAKGAPLTQEEVITIRERYDQVRRTSRASPSTRCS